MKLQAFALCLILLFSPSLAFADDNKQGLSFTVDGPANIRDTKNGIVIDSLPDGYVVNVLNSGDSGWYKIEYVLQNKTKSGWTHEGNLKFVVMPLADLIKNNKVTYASHPLAYYGENEIVLFGKSIPFYEIGDGIYRAEPVKPINVKVHCIDGAVQENQILYIDLEYGGDAASWSGNIVTVNQIKNNDCIYPESVTNSNRLA